MDDSRLVHPILDTAGLGLLDGGQGISRLSGLADRDNQCLFINNRVAITEFAGHINTHRHPSQVFNTIFSNKTGMISRPTSHNKNTLNRLFKKTGFKRRAFFFLSDILLISFAMYASFWLRFNGTIPDHYMKSLPYFILLALFLAKQLGVEVEIN